jgi:hypothetical protein
MNVNHNVMPLSIKQMTGAPYLPVSWGDVGGPLAAVLNLNQFFNPSPFRTQTNTEEGKRWSRSLN